MQRIKVKPSKPELIVKDEFGRIIPSEGKMVNYTIFIRRRIKDKDLIVVQEEKNLKIKKDKEVK